MTTEQQIDVGLFAIGMQWMAVGFLWLGYLALMRRIEYTNPLRYMKLVRARAAFWKMVRSDFWHAHFG